ncbi:MAG: ADP-ribosylglycohydrolase family protein [Clostridia bacterium]|nr:ADP-ribosylglycohydrolase family protein [Clostridia bacterium]
MIGAIIGDIVGSRFEFIENDGRGKDFLFWARGCRPTDDSFMTLAVAKALYLCKGDYSDLAIKTINCMRNVAAEHPNTGWGGNFYRWLFESRSTAPINSFGNGAGMRISPVAWVAESEKELKELAAIVTGVTHNHPEGMKGGEAIALSVWLARTGADKQEIKRRMIEYYPILADKSFTIESLQQSYGYDNLGAWVTCQGSVPHAILAFLESTGFEDAVRNAVSIGGDSDTIGAMAGSIAEAYYGVNEELEEKALSYLPVDLLGIYYAFSGIRKPRTERKQG